MENINEIKEQHKKMRVALKDIIKIKSLITITGNIPESKYDEAMAIDFVILKIESLLKEIKK